MTPTLGVSTLEPDPIGVLLIEDHLGDVELLIALLASRAAPRVDLTPVRTITEAHVAREKGPFHVLLLDLDLPDARGLDGLKRLCAPAPTAPIVVVTGVDDTDLARRALARPLHEVLGQESPSRCLAVLCDCGGPRGREGSCAGPAGRRKPVEGVPRHARRGESTLNRSPQDHRSRKVPPVSERRPKVAGWAVWADRS